MTRSLTPRQQAALEFIASYQATHKGRSPSMREIATALSVNSMSHVSNLLWRLHEKAFVRMRYGGKRSIEVLQLPADFVSPVVELAICELVTSKGPEAAESTIRTMIGHMAAGLPAPTEAQ